MHNYFSIAGLLICFINLGLALLITFFGRNKLHKVWSYVNYSISIWGFSMYVIGSTMNNNVAFSGCKMFTVGIALIALFYYHVIYIFCKLKSSKFLIFGYLESLFFILLTIFTNFMFGDKVVFSFNQFYYFRANLLYNFFMFIWSIVVGKSFFELFKYIKKSQGVSNTQAKYLFVAMLFGFGGGLNTAPAAWGLNIYPYGQIFVCLYGVVATYAIFRYRIMDIRLAVSYTVIFISVYAFVLGIPFVFGYKYNEWEISTWAMLILATTGPLLFNYLRHKAENKIQEEDLRYQNTLITASEGFKTLKTKEEIVPFAYTILNKSMRLTHVAIYLMEEGGFKLNGTNNHNGYAELISLDHSLIKCVDKFGAFIVYELENKTKNGVPEIKSTIEYLKEVQACLVVPIVEIRNIQGLIILGEKSNNLLYSDRDIAVLKSVANQMAMALRNAQNLKSEIERIAKEGDEERIKLVNQAVETIMHQINTPLHAIKGTFHNIDLALDEFPEISIEFKDFIRLMIVNAMKSIGLMSELIRLIRTVSKSDIEIKSVNLKDVLEIFNFLNKEQLKANKDVKLSLAVQDNLPSVCGNSTFICEILDVFFVNAMHATEKNEGDRLIQIKISQINDSFVRLMCTDNGSGIKADVKEKLFRTVYTSKPGQKGRGIGLARLRNICEWIEAVYNFESEGPGKGSSFWVDLKIVPQQTELSML